MSWGVLLFSLTPCSRYRNSHCGTVWWSLSWEFPLNPYAPVLRVCFTHSFIVSIRKSLVWFNLTSWGPNTSCHFIHVCTLLLQYSRYLEPFSQAGVHHVFERACTIHLPRKPLLHMHWAAFEERQGNEGMQSSLVLWPILCHLWNLVKIIFALIFILMIQSCHNYLHAMAV